MSAKLYLRIIKIPILIAILQHFALTWLNGYLLDSIRLGLFDLIRIANIFFAGWLIIQNKKGNLWLAALSGPILILVDVLLAGGHIIIGTLLNPSIEGNRVFLAFFGIISSFVVLSPFYMLIGFIGGWFSRNRRWERNRL